MREDRIFQTSLRADFPAGFRVKLIESDPQRAKRVADSLQDTEVEIFCSNPSDINFILEEHIYDSDYFIAATNDDETNIISSFMIKRTNHAKTFTIIRNESYLTLASSREIDTIVSPKDATISELLSNIRQDGLEKLICSATVWQKALNLQSAAHA